MKAKKDQGPPKGIEAIVARLTPPACREDVLGDLHERYTSSMQYLRDVLETLPFVIFSQVRRTVEAGEVMAQAVMLLFSFSVAWTVFDPDPLMPPPYAAMLLPIIAALTVLVAGRAYTLREQRSRSRAAIEAVGAMTCAVATQFVAFFTAPMLVLPAPVSLVAVYLSIILLALQSPSAGRERLPETVVVGRGLSIREPCQRACDFEARGRQRNRKQ